MAAYERVLAGGVPALLEVQDGVRLFESFAITENLRRRELREWLGLVKAHFPTSPELARTTAERLLREGEECRRALRRR